jgi:hypothetical protein
MRKTGIHFLGSVAVGCIIFSIIVSGCSPEMRKKFIRERKKDTNENMVMPVLDPEEYPNMLETTRTRYDYFYALLKVWQKDALALIDDRASDKQMRYALGQVAVQLQELTKIFDGPSRDVAQNGIQKVDEILVQYDKPEAFRNNDIIRRDIQRLADTVIKPLSPEAVLRDLK